VDKDGSLAAIQEYLEIILPVGEKAILLFTSEMEAPPADKSFLFTVDSSVGVLAPFSSFGFFTLFRRPQNILN